MKNLNEELEFRIKNLQLENEEKLYDFFKKFNEDEISMLLKADPFKVDEYLKFISKLYENNRVYDNEKEIKEIANLILKNRDAENTKCLKELLLKTRILSNANVVNFSIEFLSLEDIKKAKSIVKILLEDKYIAEGIPFGNSYIMKILSIISSIDDCRKIPIITSIFTNLLKNKEFISDSDLIALIERIKISDYSDNLIYVVEILKNNPSLLHNPKLYNIFNALLKVKSDSQAKLLLEVSKKSKLLNNNEVLEEIIKVILNLRQYRSLRVEQLSSLINDCENLTYGRLVALLGYMKKVHNEFQSKAIIYFDSNTIDSWSESRFNLIMKTILKANEPFQIKYVLEFLEKGIDMSSDEDLMKLFFDRINESKNDYQSYTVFALLEECIKNSKVKSFVLETCENEVNLNSIEIINIINNIQNREVCLQLIEVLNQLISLESSNSRRMDILKKYARLKSKEQYLAFKNIIKKRGFINNEKALEILDILILAEPCQAIALQEMVINKNNFDELSERGILKNLLVSKNPDTIKFIAVIILKEYDLDKMEEQIKIILDRKTRLTHIRNNIMRQAKYDDALATMKQKMHDVYEGMSLLDKMKMKVKK